MKLAKTLTDEQKKIYVENGGSVCPYCGSEYIEINGSPQVEGLEVHQELYCTDCGRGWCDSYILNDVVEM